LLQRLSPTDPDFLARLRDQLEQRLVDLNRERSRVKRALQELQPVVAQPALDIRDRVLAEVSAEPGSRGSMIALSLGESAEDVARVLSDLAAVGVVERRGMGWFRQS
jgi:predicted transcriptional regulator